MAESFKFIAECARWFEARPTSNPEDFCRHYLNRKKTDSKKIDRTSSAGLLLKVMGRIVSAFSLYQRAALKSTAIPFAGSFFYLNALAALGEARKTELIKYLFAEYTTGMEAISKLRKASLIEEKDDPTDRRAKLVRLTPKGKKLLKECYRLTTAAASLIFNHVDSETIRICHQLLKGIEERHSTIVMRLKSEDFDVIEKEAGG